MLIAAPALRTPAAEDPVDTSLFRSVNRLAGRTHWAHPLFRTYAEDGIALFAMLLLVGWFLERRDDDVAGVAAVVGAGIATLLAVGLVQLIGNVVDRARPYTAMPSAHLLVSKTADFSFPSDHATAVGAVAVGLLLTRRPLGAVACALAVLMAFSRVYVGAHYPGDVLAGLVLGGLTAAAVRPLAIRVLTPLLDRLRGTPLRTLIVSRR
jgi:undecaprenyl-diphosphatase